MYPLFLTTQNSLLTTCRWKVDGRRIGFQKSRKSEKAQYLLVVQEWVDEDPSILIERLKTKKLKDKPYTQRVKKGHLKILSLVLH